MFAVLENQDFQQFSADFGKNVFYSDVYATLRAFALKVFCVNPGLTKVTEQLIVFFESFAVNLYDALVDPTIKAPFLYQA